MFGRAGNKGTRHLERRAKAQNTIQAKKGTKAKSGSPNLTAYRIYGYDPSRPASPAISKEEIEPNRFISAPGYYSNKKLLGKGNRLLTNTEEYRTAIYTKKHKSKIMGIGIMTGMMVLVGIIMLVV